jgi:hypothetical protein
MAETDSNLKSNCNTCKREQYQTVLKQHEYRFSDDENQISGETKWEIIRCGGCGTISFREVEWFSENYDENGRVYPVIRVYPQPELDARPTKPFLNVPQKIRQVYGEVIETFNRRAHLLCAGGLRAIIEGVCAAERIRTGPVKVKTKGGGSKIVRRKDLRAKIEGMLEKGLITKEHRKTLHEHRFLGNEALHELQTPESAELSIAISIVEHTLEHLYEMRSSVQKLRALKQQRKLKGRRVRARPMFPIVRD